MTWLAWGIAFVSLWLAAGLLYVCREFRRDLASVWQALAELRMHHNALERATTEALEDVGKVLTDIDSGPPCMPMWAEPTCNCKRCRERRELARN